MSVTYQVEKFTDTVLEAVPLLEQHWAEITHDKMKMKLNPDIAAYKALDQVGQLLIITARSDGKLIGYIIFIVCTHLHYKDILVATDDIHYIHPEFRKGLIGYKLFRFAEKELSSRNVDMVLLRTKVKMKNGPLFERLGYTAVDVDYCKFLGE